jgi:hypothetical protein
MITHSVPVYTDIDLVFGDIPADGIRPQGKTAFLLGLIEGRLVMRVGQPETAFQQQEEACGNQQSE